MHIFQNKKDKTKDLEKYFDIVKIEGYIRFRLKWIQEKDILLLAEINSS